MFFAYEQQVDDMNVPLPEHRSRFDLSDWIESFGGENAVRGPIASIGYVSEY